MLGLQHKHCIYLPAVQIPRYGTGLRRQMKTELNEQTTCTSRRTCYISHLQISNLSFITSCPTWKPIFIPKKVCFKKRRIVACQPRHSASLFSIIRRWLKGSRTQSRGPPKRKATAEEWHNLIKEFEERSGGSTAVPPDKPILNPEQFESLPYIESAYMTALATVLWYLGRMLRLDAFLLLFYPLPTMYIASRYGLNFATYTILSTLFFVFTIVGPFFAVTYLLNTGLLTAVYSGAIWFRLGWRGTLLSGAAAKAVGLCLQLLFITPILRHNAWKAVTEQVTLILENLIKLLNFVGISFTAPSIGAVQIAIIVVIALHSIYHVFFTLLMANIFLRRIGEEVELKRSPPSMPLVDALIQSAKRTRIR